MADFKKASERLQKLKLAVAEDIAIALERAEAQNSDTKNNAFRNVLVERVNAYEVYKAAQNVINDVMPKRRRKADE